jgi:hypothetical protein
MTKPSWQNYGTYGESAHMDLWDGVVGYWAPCLGPTGTRLHDVSRYNNWGTLTNMDPPTDWVIGGGQYALDFDGSNDYVTGPAPSLALPAPFTVSFWYYPRSRNAYAGIVSTMTVYSEADSNGWVIQDGAAAGAGSIGVICGGSQLRTTGSNSVLNTWQQYTAVVSGSGSAIYRNGVLQASGTTGTASYTGTPAIKIGSFVTASGFSNALIDDVIVHRRLLSVNTIVRLYNLGRGGMLDRRPRRRAYVQQAGFQAAWARQRTQLIGGGLR